MKLIVDMEVFINDLRVILVEDASKDGALNTLKALRAIVVEKMEK